MTKLIEIKNTTKRVYGANDVDLVPGLNKVPAADAEKFLSHPHIQIKVERGLIELGKGVELPKVSGAKKATKATETKAEKAAAAKKAKEEKEAADKKAAEEKAIADKEAADKAAAEKAAADAANAGGDGSGDNDPEYYITGLNAKDSIDKIATIEDEEYLKKIAAEDERSTVVEAAEDRLLELV